MNMVALHLHLVDPEMAVFFRLQKRGNHLVMDPVQTFPPIFGGEYYVVPQPRFRVVVGYVSTISLFHITNIVNFLK